MGGYPHDGEHIRWRWDLYYCARGSVLFFLGNGITPRVFLELMFFLAWFAVF